MKESWLPPIRTFAAGLPLHSIIVEGAPMIFDDAPVIEAREHAERDVLELPLLAPRQRRAVLDEVERAHARVPRGPAGPHRSVRPRRKHERVAPLGLLPPGGEVG